MPASISRTDKLQMSNMPPARASPQSWEEEDDQLLTHLKEDQKLGWRQIASHFIGRTSNACQFRWRRLKSGQLKSHSIPPSITSPNTSNSRIKKSETRNVNTNQQQSLQSSTSESKADQLIKELDAKKTCLLKSSCTEESSMSSATSQSESEDEELASSTNQYHQQQHPTTKAITTATSKWTTEEDTLLLNKSKMNLSFDELSILLSIKTNTEISDRIQFLESKRRLSIQSLLSSDDDSYIQSSSGSSVQTPIVSAVTPERLYGAATAASNSNTTAKVEHVVVASNGEKFLFKNIVAETKGSGCPVTV